MFRVTGEGSFPLYNHLFSLGESDLGHVMRHPADTLLIKIGNVERTLNLLALNIPNSIDDEDNPNFDNEMSKIVFDYVIALDELYDAVLIIMKSISPKSDSENKDANLWLMKNQREQLTRFKGSVDRYHKLIRNIANKIKHDVLDLTCLRIKNSKGEIVYGFYFSNIIGGEDLSGPDPEIHKEYKGSSTAFSYNFFVRYTIGYVTYCMRVVNDIWFAGKPEKVERSMPGILSIINKLNQVSDSFFPDEYLNYVSKLIEDNGKLCVEFPSKAPYDRANVDKIKSVLTSLKFNQRTGKAHDKFPYHKLIWGG